jgi:ketosteroid isomerase-like protein
MSALERQDGPALERFLSDDFYIASPGELKKVGRDEWLKNATGMRWSGLKFNRMKVDVYGDTAVVTSLLDFRVAGPLGLPIRSDAQIVDVWLRQNGRWQVAARHLGAYSLEKQLHIAGGFVAGLVLCTVVWVLLRWRRKTG